MPVVLAMLGVMEIFGGLMMMAIAPSVLRVIAGILIVGFALLTFARAAVVYQLERVNLYHRQQSAPAASIDAPPERSRRRRRPKARRLRVSRNIGERSSLCGVHSSPALRVLRQF